MLYLDYNIPDDDVIFDPTGRFRYNKDLDWFKDPTVLKIAKDVDEVDYITGDIFVHPDFGTVDSDHLSGGCHTLILAYKGCTDGLALPLSWLGENCFPVLGRLNIVNDIVFSADTMPQILEWKCEFISKRTGAVIDNSHTYLEELREFTLSKKEYAWF